MALPFVQIFPAELELLMPLSNRGGRPRYSELQALTSNQKVFFAVAMRPENTPFPQRDIVEKTGLARRTVQNALRRLALIGLIEIQPRSAPNGGTGWCAFARPFRGRDASPSSSWRHVGPSVVEQAASALSQGACAREAPSEACVSGGVEHGLRRSVDHRSVEAISKDGKEPREAAHAIDNAATLLAKNGQLDDVDIAGRYLDRLQKLSPTTRYRYLGLVRSGELTPADVESNVATAMDGNHPERILTTRLQALCLLNQNRADPGARSSLEVAQAGDALDQVNGLVDRVCASSKLPVAMTPDKARAIQLRRFTEERGAK